MIGKTIYCTVCHLRKKPLGRLAPMAMAGSLCDDNCRGYRQEPYPDVLWPNEELERVAKMITIADKITAEEFRRSQGHWYPACGGTETEFKTRTGRRLLYCWQPSTGRHAYLDLGSDIILTDEEAQLALGNV